MSKEKNVKILYRIVGILFISTMLTTCWVSGSLAKYVTSGNGSDSGRVAGTGVVQFEVLEHEAKETYRNSGVYQLLEDEDPVKENKYRKVLPGVDIPKDPYVQLHLKNNEVDYELYVEVTEKNFPTYEGKDQDGNPVSVKAVKYRIGEDWKLVEDRSDSDKGVYVYKYDKYIDSNFNSNEKIYILKDNMLYVSEHFVGDGRFSLVFRAYLKQID